MQTRQLPPAKYAMNSRPSTHMPYAPPEAVLTSSYLSLLSREDPSKETSCSAYSHAVDTSAIMLQALLTPHAAAEGADASVP